MDHRVELRHLRAFCAVAEELHFGRAARRLGLSQPPLSLQVRRLEEQVGARLFERSSRRVALTDAGAALYPQARRLLQELESALAAAGRAGAGAEGLLRVAFAPSMMFQLLPEVVRRFREAHPGVRLELRELPTARQLAALRAGELDVAFAREPQADAALRLETIASEPLRVALARQHPLARRRQLRLSALRAEPWVLFPRDIAPGLHDQVLGLCRSAGFSPRVVQESHEIFTTVGLVGAGVGVTIVPAVVERMGWSGVVYKPIPRAATQVAMAWAAGPERPVVRHFLTIARDEARGRGARPLARRRA